MKCEPYLCIPLSTFIFVHSMYMKTVRSQLLHTVLLNWFRLVFVAIQDEQHAQNTQFLLKCTKDKDQLRCYCPNICTVFSLGAAYEVLLIDDCCGYLPLTKQTYTLKGSSYRPSGMILNLIGSSNWKAINFLKRIKMIRYHRLNSFFY